MSINSTSAIQAGTNIAYQKRALSAFEQVRAATINSQPGQNGQHQQGGNGDSVEFSREARASLAQARGQSSGYGENAPTYDRTGQLARQIDSLQGGLSSLASTLRQTPRRAGIAAYVNGIQSRLSSLEMQV